MEASAAWFSEKIWFDVIYIHESSLQFNSMTSHVKCIDAQSKHHNYVWMHLQKPYTQDLKTESQTFTSGIEIPIFCTEWTSKTINSNRKLHHSWR